MKNSTQKDVSAGSVLVNRESIAPMMLGRLSDAVTAWEQGNNQALSGLTSGIMDLAAVYEQFASSTSESVTLFPGVGQFISGESAMGEIINSLRASVETRNTEAFRDAVDRLTQVIAASAHDESSVEEHQEEASSVPEAEEETTSEPSEVPETSEPESAPESTPATEESPAEAPAETETSEQPETEAPPAAGEPEQQASSEDSSVEKTKTSWGGDLTSDLDKVENYHQPSSWVND